VDIGQLLIMDRVPGTIRRRALTSRPALPTLRAQGPQDRVIIGLVDPPTGISNREDVKGSKAARRSGRPSRADALLLRETILEVATQLFLNEGYGSTTIEAVAMRAGISKRTFYDRFDDKAILFAAVVHRIIEQIRPPPEVPLLAGATLPIMLQRLASLILRAALSPQAIALHRLVTAESVRFPELAFALESDASQSEATNLIGDLLMRELPNAQFTADTRRFAAEQFIHMVATVPRRRAMGHGTPMNTDELDLWAGQVVKLFLDGYQGLRK
jgi:TetR/AcrR family transcriptional repressor of mexJK operon